MDNISINEHNLHPENYGWYYPGKEKGYNLPTDHATVEMILSSDDIFDKILRECLSI